MESAEMPSLIVEVGKERLSARYTTVVGAMVTLTADTTDPVQWTIGGGQYTATNYDISLAGGTVTRLTDEDLQSNPITFAWWLSGTYAVSFTVGGCTSVITYTFDVTAPLVRDVSWTAEETGEVAVGFYKNEGRFIRLADKTDFNEDGMHMKFIIAGKQSEPGVVAGIQIACTQRVAKDDQMKPMQWRTNGSHILDVGVTNTVLYGNRTVALQNNGETIEYHANDGPGQGMELDWLRAVYIGDGIPVVPEMYTMYVMFRPDVEAAIWVPIKTLNWGWEGYTEYDNGSWQPVKDGKITKPVAFDPLDFPQWTDTTRTYMGEKRWTDYKTVPQI